MRAFRWLCLLVVSGCGGLLGHESQSVDCSSGQTPIYSNRFSPERGASGVATAADAQAGRTSSDPNAAVPSTTDTPTAMTITCGQASCGSGQVAVEVPPTTGGPGTGATSTGDSTGAPTGGSPTGGSDPSGTTVCTDPPPNCPQGQSPQFTLKKTWVCTDCTLVVTYGGIYGNYRRCVGKPDVTCTQGNVPTWVFEDEQWECKTKCDNGQYDQHTIAGTLVCVPC